MLIPISRLIEIVVRPGVTLFIDIRNSLLIVATRFAKSLVGKPLLFSFVFPIFAIYSFLVLQCIALTFRFKSLHPANLSPVRPRLFRLNENALLLSLDILPLTLLLTQRVSLLTLGLLGLPPLYLPLLGLLLTLNLPLIGLLLALDMHLLPLFLPPLLRLPALDLLALALLTTAAPRVSITAPLIAATPLLSVRVPAVFFTSSALTAAVALTLAKRRTGKKNCHRQQR